MARRMYDHRCRQCNEVFDVYCDYEEKEQPHECGGVGYRIMSVTNLEYLHSGVDMSMPTAADKWAKMHRDEAKRANKLSRKD